MTLKEQIYIVCEVTAAMPSSSIFLIQRQVRRGRKHTQNQHSEPQCAETAQLKTLSNVISQSYAMQVSPYE